MLSKPSRRELFKVGTAATTGIIFSGCSFSSSGYSKAHQPNPVYSKTNRPNIIFILLSVEFSRFYAA